MKSRLIVWIFFVLKCLQIVHDVFQGLVFLKLFTYTCYTQTTNIFMKSLLISLRNTITVFLLFMSHFTNAQSWTQVNVGTVNDVYCVEYVNSTTIILAGYDGIIKSTNSGATWNTYPYLDNLGNPIPLSWFYDMHFFDANNGVASGFIATGNSETILRTSNGGLNWTIVSVYNSGTWPRMINDIGFLSGTVGVAVGTNGRILRTTNAGSTWGSISSPTSNELKGVSFATTLIGEAVGNQRMLRTINGGTSWTATSTPAYNLESVHFVNSTIGYAVGNVILKTIDAGVSWTQVSSISGTDVYAVDNDSAFICNTGVYKTSNLGAFWGTQPSIIPGTYNDLDFVNVTDGYVVGDNGMVFKTTTGGEPLPQTDAGIFVVEPYSSTICPTIMPVRAKLRNYGALTLNSANIYWSVNGVLQGTIPWTGTLLSDSTTAYINLGNYNFNFSSQLVRVWTGQPNAISDQFTGNDTASTTFATQKLQGTYTIGGTTPDFATFAAAVTQVNSYGVCGNVIFNVRNGTYTENLSLIPYTGAGISGSLTFQAESGDSSLVTLTSSSGNTVSLNGCDYVTFQKMTIQTTNGYAIEFKNGSNSNSIKNCFLKGATTGTTSNLSIIGYTGTTSSDILIQNNYFKYGSYGIYLSGATASLITNISIIDNLFTDQNAKGIYLLYSYSAIIKGNTINNYLTTAFEGLHFSNSSGSYDISYNKIYTSIGTGLWLYFCANSISTEGLVFNNFVRTGVLGGSIGTAFVNHSSYYIKIYNNTFYSLGTHGFSLTYYNLLPAGLKVVNNIIAARGAGCAIAIYNSTSGLDPATYNPALFTEIGPNAYFNNASNLMSWQSGLPTIYDWKNNFTKDSLSFVVDPQFINANDLHIYPNSSNYQLESAGIPWGGLTNDIDGDSRIGIPDIGADEFSVPSLDLQLYTLADTARICLGSNSLMFNVINHGTTTITSFTTNWKINGVTQTPYTWTGSLAPGDTTVYFSTGLYSFTPGTYTVKAWTSSPNGGSDLIGINDTLNDVISAGGLSGTYVIGTVPSSYLTINSAVADLIAQGVCGPVVFDIKSGTYNEQVVVPSINGASIINTITFRSQSGDSTSVDWRFAATSANNYVLRLNGADYIHIEKMTIQSTTSAYSTALHMQSGCNYNIIESCRFIGKPNSVGKLVWGGNSVDNYNTYRNNYFISGQTALYVEAAYGTNEKGTVISNNYFYNTRFRCIEICFQDGILIDKNKMSCDTVMTGTSAAIYITWTRLTTVVSNNNIRGRFAEGIFWDGHGGGAFTRPVVYNNMIHNMGLQANHCLMLHISCTYSYVLHNSLFLETNTTYLYGAAGKIYSKYNTVLNNIFYSSNTNGTAFDPYTYSYLTTCDNNIYFKPNGGSIFGGGTYPSLLSWQTATPFDDNSFHTDPVFVSSSDLHLGTSYSAENNGTNVFSSLVNKDIDGQTRSSSAPDIGADEFNLTLLLSDAGVFQIINPAPMCIGVNPVKVVFRNYSSVTLNSVSISWSVNGVTQPLFNWTGSVASLAYSDTITLGTYNFTAADTFLIKSWTSLPNGVADGANVNDTTSLANIKTKLSGTLTIGGSSPDYMTTTAACAELTSLGICGPVTFVIRNGVYPQINLSTIFGSSSTNTITFRSESGNRNDVVIEGANINGTDYLTIRDVTLMGVLSSPNSLKIYGGSNYNRYINNKFTGYDVYSTGDTDNYMVFDSCLFERWVFLQGQPSGALEKGMTLRYNTFTYLNGGVRLDRIDSLEIMGNTFTTTSPAASDKGIALQGCKGKIKILQNRIWGNYVSGMQLNDCDGSAGIEMEIINNAVSGNRTSYIGIELTSSSSYAHVYHNSIDAGGSSSAGLAIGSGATVRSFNNSIKSLGGWIYFIPTTGATFVSDYNNIYYSSAIYYNGITYTSLAAYQTASGRDLNSISVNPLYVSSTYLFPAEPALYNAGLGQGVVNDLNNYPRNMTTPVIGAYEIPESAPVVMLGNDSSYCGNQTLNAGNPGSVYLWNTGAISQAITATTTGLYWVTVSNALGTDSDTLSITIIPKPNSTISAIADSICVGACISFNTNTIGGTPEYTYVWEPTYALNDTSISNPTSCIQDEYFTVVVTDLNGCSDTSSFFFEEPQMPWVSVGPVVTICPGDPANLVAYADGIETFQWSPPITVTSPNDSSTTAYPLTSTNYTIVVTTNMGCQDSTYLYVNVSIPPGTPSITQIGSTLYSSVFTDYYQWYLNGTPIPGAIYDYYDILADGNYTLVVTNYDGCSDTSAIFVVTTTEVESNLSIHTFVASPNPANDYSYCKIELSPSENGVIELFDLIGNKVDQKELAPGKNEKIFDLILLSNGLYLYKVIINNELRISKKLIITK